MHFISMLINYRPGDAAPPRIDRDIFIAKIASKAYQASAGSY